MIGTWDFERIIADRAAEETSRVTGTTELIRDGGRVRWSERGIFFWHGQEIPVSRVLGIEPRDDGWFVTFEDGRDFHPWAPGEPVEHPCGADLYRGRVLITDHEHWQVEWTVTGPEKDYTMTTRLRRSRPRHPHLLFSYGTLQLPSVQVTTFGRPIEGEADAIVGSRLGQVHITDPHVVAASGSDVHPALIPTTDPEAEVPGTVYALDDAQLASADDYEVDAYVRVEVSLRSGRKAWVYALDEKNASVV